MLSQALNSNKFDEESINTVVMCQIRAIPGRYRILLQPGTSKGNICVYELIIQGPSSKCNDSSNNNNIDSNSNSGSGMIWTKYLPIKCDKLKMLSEAHGKTDVDDLQVLEMGLVFTI